jgi:hypothetical protein
MDSSTDTCIFCDAPANSGEHLFPDWVLRQLKLKYDGFKNTVGGKVVDEVMGKDLKMSCVCQNCNNRWMNDMEVTTKKFMSRMIEGHKVQLTKQEQQTLTEWCVKTAMCQDTTTHHKRFFTDAECKGFKAKRTLPEHCKAWTARINKPKLNIQGSDFTLTIGGSAVPVLHASVFTMHMGQLVLQALIWHMQPGWEKAEPDFVSKPAQWDKLIVQVWPNSKELKTWPPRTAMHRFNDLSGSYDYFAERFKNPGMHRLSNLPWAPKS